MNGDALEDTRRGNYNTKMPSTLESTPDETPGSPSAPKSRGSNLSSPPSSPQKIAPDASALVSMAVSTDSVSKAQGSQAQGSKAQGSTAPGSTAPGSKAPFPRRRRQSLHNFWALVAFQTSLRTGWIFKTESIIIPAVLDAIGGSPVLRGCLPLLNRFGQSVPPMAASAAVARVAKKKHLLAAMTAIMSLCFGALAWLWTIPAVRDHRSFPLVYLALYTLFFAATGIMQLVFGTLQGKLVMVTSRGRLMMMANLVGASSAILLASLCLPRWLAMGIAGFPWIFGCSAVCFAIAAGIALTLWEPRYRASEADQKSRSPMFAAAWRTLKQDANFRRLGIVAALFGSSMMLFPHYQALARDALDIEFHHLYYWVVIQNAGTASFSFIVGPMADRAGNRRVIRLLLVLLMSAPLLALALAELPVWGPRLFPLVFLLVGLTPVGVRVLNNYTLEVTDMAQQPKYLATLGLCFAVPIVLSPLLGWVVQSTGYFWAFLVITVAIGLAFAVSWTLEEPRHGKL